MLRLLIRSTSFWVAKSALSVAVDMANPNKVINLMMIKEIIFLYCELI